MHSSDSSQEDQIAVARSGCSWQTADGNNLRLRPIASDDIELVAAFLAGLSAGARYFRFGRVDAHFAEAAWAAMCNPDPAACRRFVVLADQGGVEIVIASGDFEIQADGETCEFTILVADAWRRARIAHRLLMVLIATAKQSRLTTMFARVLATNKPMLQFLQRKGFVGATVAELPAIRNLYLRLDGADLQFR